MARGEAAILNEVEYAAEAAVYGPARVDLGRLGFDLARYVSIWLLSSFALVSD